MIVVGIDPATYELGLAAVRVSPKGKRTTLLDMKHISVDEEKNLAQRLEYIYQEAHSFLKKNKPDFIAIESQHLKNARAMRIVAYSVGVLAIAGMLVSPGVPVEIIEAKRWRKLAFDNGNISKKGVRTEVATRFNVDEEKLTLDVAEAIGIAVAGVKLVKG